MNVATVREAIAKKIKDHLADLRNDDPDFKVQFQVSPYVLTNPTANFIQVFPSSSNYNTAMGRGHDARSFTIQVATALTSDIGAQKAIDHILSNDVIPNALYARDDTDPWQDIHVESDTGYTRFEKDGSAPLLGVEITVTVIA